MRLDEQSGHFASGCWASAEAQVWAKNASRQTVRTLRVGLGADPNFNRKRSLYVYFALGRPNYYASNSLVLVLDVEGETVQESAELNRNLHEIIMNFQEFIPFFHK
jgi:hypothetical protein